MIGLTVGAVRMTMDFVYPEPGCGEVDQRPLIISRVHYMYFALMLFMLTGISVVIISYAGKRPEPYKVAVYYDFLYLHRVQSCYCSRLRRSTVASVLLVNNLRQVNGRDTIFVRCVSVCASVHSGPVNQTSLKRL